MGKWEVSAGKWHGSADDTALKTTQDARFYGLSAKLDSPFSNDGKDLVVQYVVKNEQKLDCGGAYVKLLPGGKSFPTASFGGDTPYSVMFGPDICGSNKRTHVILNHPSKEDNLLIKKDVKTETDQLSHLYTLHIKADNTFEVFIDNKSVRAGSLEEEFDFLEPKEIEDPNVSKPTDWVDERMIPDPDDKKPEGFDDIPPEIPSPDAKRPDDWDDKDDGEWEAPMIPNPDYMGDKWMPKMIENPDYKGPWEHPKIPNDKYKPDPKLHAQCKDCTHIGFELWQVTSGTSFDNIIVTDSLAEAQAFAEETFFKMQAKEKKMHDDVKEAEREENARKAKEAEAAAKFQAEMEEPHSEL